jgi:uncharacterized membrane protein
MSNTWTEAEAPAGRGDIAVRRIGIPDLRAALAAGIDDFKAHPTQLVFLCILYPIIGLAAARVAASGELMPLLFPLVSGFALVGPVLAVGLYEISKRRERGLPTSWLNAFDVLRSPALFSVLILGVALFAILIAWVAAANGIYRLTIGDPAPASLDAFLQQLGTSPGLPALILVGDAVGACFAALVLTLAVVSFPMLIDRNVGVGTAVATSFRAVMANPVAMLVWGAIVAGVLVLGCIPLFVGLAVALPILGHATWHLYRKVVA